MTTLADSALRVQAVRGVIDRDYTIEMHPKVMGRTLV